MNDQQPPPRHEVQGWRNKVWWMDRLQKEVWFCYATKSEVQRGVVEDVCWNGDVIINGKSYARHNLDAKDVETKENS